MGWEQKVMEGVAHRVEGRVKDRQEGDGATPQSLVEEAQDPQGVLEGSKTYSEMSEGEMDDETMDIAKKAMSSGK